MNVKVKRYVVDTIKTLALPVIVIALFAILTGGRSLTKRMLLVTARQSVMPIIISMALMGNMKLGMWDFSAGGVVLSAAIIGGNLMKMTNTGIPGLVFFCLFIAIAMATLTGYLNNKLRVPTLVVTIGLVLIYETIPRAIFPGGVTIRAKYTTLASSPYCFIILAIMFAGFYLMYNKTAYGHNIRALGGSHEIAKSAGLNAPRIIQIGFSISGIFLGIGAVIYVSTNGQLMTVTALGSVATIFEAMMGVFLAFFLSQFCNLAVALVVGTFTMTALTNGLVAMGLPATMRSITSGLFLLILLCISANQERIIKWRADRQRAREIMTRSNSGTDVSKEM